jgi:hypothetical protein
VRGVGTG